MSKSLLWATLLLAATAALFADSFTITVNITSTNDGTTIPTGTYTGAFNTNGACSLCTVANGGITSFHVPIQTGTSVTDPAVLLFDALDSSNLTGTLPQYSTATQSLSSTGSPTILMLEQIKSGTNPNVGYPFLVLMEMTPTTLNTPPTTCDSQDTVRIGCVSIRPVEGVFAQGTYTITQSACSSPLTPVKYNVNESSRNASEIIWFNSHLSKLSGTVPNSDFQLNVTGGTITFGSLTVNVPDGVISFSSSASCAQTTFNTSTNTWQTTIPLSAASNADEIFIAGLAYELPPNFSQNVTNVTWSANISSSAPGIQATWQYGVSNWLTANKGSMFPVLSGSPFVPDYNGMMVNPAHNAPWCGGNSGGDHAGAPEFAGRHDLVTGGGSGGGGSNWTGSWSSTPPNVLVCSQ